MAVRQTAPRFPYFILCRRRFLKAVGDSLRALFTVVFLTGVCRCYGDAEQNLGGLLFNDPNLSLNRNQSCATCHSPTPATNPATLQPFGTPGFVYPLNVFNGTPVSAG